MSLLKLRQYQNTAFSSVLKAIVVFFSVLMVIPTGGGKTVVFTYMAQRASLKNKKTLILVHRIELLRQTSKALQGFFVEHGMVHPDYTPNFRALVQVASLQTIIRRLNYFAAIMWVPDVIIIDEAHHATSKSYRKIIEFFKALNPNIRIIGVTATPIRSDGQGLGENQGGMFSEIVLGPTPRWLQDEGFLVRARVQAPPKQFADPKRKKGDWNANDLENLVNKPVITGDAVDHYEQVCKGVPTIVFCVSVAHTEEVAKAFRDRGYKFYAIDGTTDDDVRKRVLKGLADGSVQGVCSCDLINEGTDVPAASCAILLRPTQSLGLHLQQIGRVLRPVYSAGFDLNNSTAEERLQDIRNGVKPCAWILDHVGNTGSMMNGEFVENHGLPDKEHEWSLEGEIKKKGKKSAEPLTRVQQCLSCFAVHAPAAICPDCGHVYEIKDRTPKSVDGELTEITSEMVAAIKKEKRITLAMSESLDDLKRIAAEQGYSDEWIGIQYKLRKPKFEKIAARKAAEALPLIDTVEPEDTEPEEPNTELFEWSEAHKEWSETLEF